MSGDNAPVHEMAVDEPASSGGDCDEPTTHCTASEDLPERMRWPTLSEHVPTDREPSSAILRS